MVHKGTFQLGKHYFKPSPKKLLFKWDAIEKWLERALVADRIKEPRQASNTSHDINPSPANKSRIII